MIFPLTGLLRTRAILAPNLIGNAPDWDVIREIADRHDLLVVECGSTKAKPPSPARTAACNACAESHKAELEQAGCAAADMKEFCG